MTPNEIKNEVQNFEDYKVGVSFSHRGDTAYVDFLYPNNNQIKYINVGLVDVRASDGIRIYYDFDRDGYVVEQQEYIDKDGYMEEGDWKETGFFPSWALEKNE